MPTAISKETKTTLGLDLGTNSIGWALIEMSLEREPKSLIAAGVRIFQEAVDAKSKVPKNQARRTARAARRLIARRRMRKETLQNILVRADLLPPAAEERFHILRDLTAYDPYILRAKGLDMELTRYEFGRVLYHLCQRRGFESNRKRPADDEGIVKTAIARLEEEICNTGSRTLGEFLSKRSSRRNRREKSSNLALYTSRNMFIEEFAKLWKAQNNFNPELYTNQLREQIFRVLFFQRPLKLQKFLVGRCSFEPSRKRAPKALLESQTFRILQTINDLTVKNPITREERSLTIEERHRLHERLEGVKQLSWARIRQLLELHQGETFNFESSGRDEILGNETNSIIRGLLKERWKRMSVSEKEALITDKLTISNPEAFLRRAQEYWQFETETAEKLANIELPLGYMNISHKAIMKLLPFLKQGKNYAQACAEAGYHHSTKAARQVVSLLGEPPYLRNPVVQKALYEARKVVNAIIRKFGLPSQINIEMAREMKLTKKQKERYQKQQKENKKRNKIVSQKLKTEFGIQNPRRDDILKYKLWEESKTLCPYTGQTISREMLFSQYVDIEHIIPYSRCLDDSYMNKTLCMAGENRSVKHNSTPVEAYSANQERYLEILRRVEDLPSPKKSKFEQKEVDTDGFVDRQLNDTRYICVEVKNYLLQLGIPISVTKGGATADLRREWGLNSILAVDGKPKKNRQDHRHHAIDAIVIALTSRTLFQRLSNLSGQSQAGLSSRRLSVGTPWLSFLDEVGRIVREIRVSHAAQRRIAGQLHDETAYGKININGETYYVTRKPLNNQISNEELNSIVDHKVRELVLARLQAHKAQGMTDKEAIKAAFGNRDNPVLHSDNTTPIRKVRIKRKFSSVMGVADNNGTEYKFYPFHRNHHVEIFQDKETRARKAVCVTTFEAAHRARVKRAPIIQRDHGPKYEFLMSLNANDMVLFESTETDRLYRVQKMSGKQGNSFDIVLRKHNAATLDDDGQCERISSASRLKNLIKVSVSILGEVSPAND